MLVLFRSTCLLVLDRHKVYPRWEQESPYPNRIKLDSCSERNRIHSPNVDQLTLPRPSATCWRGVSHRAGKGQSAPLPRNRETWGSRISAICPIVVVWFGKEGFRQAPIFQVVRTLHCINAVECTFFR